MKVLSVSNVKTKLGRVIDGVIKTQEPVVIPRGGRHVVILPYDLPTPDEMKLARVFDYLDKGREPIEEGEETVAAIQAEIRKYRSEKRRRK